VKKRILLADDDHAVLESLGHVLASENYEVALARTGHEALGKFLTGRADLVLLDLNMPNQDGWRTFDLIETLAPLLPVIIITARPNQYGRAAALRIDALMEKPLDLPLLLATIRKLLAEAETDRIARLTRGDFKTAYLNHPETVSADTER